jgi:hypothetical protein
MDLYIVRHVVDHDGESIWYISEDKQEAITKAEFYLELRRKEGRACFDEAIEVSKYREGKLDDGASWVFENLEPVFSERVC